MILVQSPWRFLFQVLWKKKGVFALIFLILTCGRSMGMLTPYILKEIVDQLSTSSISLTRLLIYVLGAVFLSELCLRFAAYLSVRPLIESFKSLKLQLFSHVMGQSYHYITEQLSGRLSSRVDQICSATEILIDLILWVFFSAIINFSVTAFFFANTHFLMGCTFFIWLSIYIPFLIWIVKKVGRQWGEVARQEAIVAGRMVDALANFFIVKVFGQNRDKEMENAIRLSVEKTTRATYFSVHSYSFQEFASLLLGICSLSISCYLFYTYQISLSEVVLILSLFMVLKEKMHSLTARTRECFKQYGILKDSLEALISDCRIVDTADVQNVFFERVDLEFDNIHFSYPNGTKVLKDLSFKVNSGDKIAFVGRSGSGKTTIINLILRLYDISEGAIRMNGIDIRQISQESLHSHIAVVPQDPILFHRSIWENIRFAKPEASDEQIKQAATFAYCDEFISHLPEGYHSVVGERGVKLSGGQRQRIAIARAILKNSPIIIFDEATSALDSESEKAIQVICSSIFQNKTIIFVTHRLTALQPFHIFVFDQGSIQERGSHGELLNKEGLYAHLWRICST